MFIPFTSTGQLLGELRAAGGDDPLWVLCVADSHGEQVPDLLEACREAGVRACGGLFPGLIHGGDVEHHGVVAIPMAAGSRLCVADMAQDHVGWRAPPPDTLVDLRSSLLLIDCLAPGVALLLEDLYDRYGSRLAHHGAGSGYHDLRPLPSLFSVEHGMLSHAALMVLTPQRTTVRVRHGWNRVAGPFVASRTQGNVITELNWEPAADFYRQLVAEESPDLAGRPVFPDINSIFPLCIAKEGGEDIMRDPIGVTAGNALHVLSDVAENAVMYLARGDADSLIAAAQQAVVDCGTPDDVQSCFISDCYSRVLKLGDTFPEELAAARSALRRFTDVTPEGVLALGEVANHGERSLELFNKTFVVALTHS